MNLWTRPRLCDSVRPERVDAVMAFGFTERQARFLVHVLVHSGVFLERQDRAFAGIAHGQNTHDFLAKLVNRGLRHGDHARRAASRSARSTSSTSRSTRPSANRTTETGSRRHSAGLSSGSCSWMPSSRIAHYTWLGTERDKVAYFVDRLQQDLPMRWYPHLTFGEGKEKTTRYFPDKLPIGVPRDGGRPHVFLYLVTREVPAEFRLFLLRHADLLKTVDEWTIRLLVPRRFRKATALYRYAVRDAFATPLTPSQVDELDWFFRARQGLRDRPGARPGSEPRDGRPEVRRGALPRAPSAVGTRGHIRPLVSPVHDSPRPAPARTGPRRIR